MTKATAFRQVTWMLGAAAAVVILVGAGGAQAAGGALDPSFGRGGRVLTDLGAKSNDGAYAVALQKDGKIVAVGGTEPSHSTDICHGCDFAIVRYATTGKLDAGFGRGGKVVTDLGGGDEWAMAVAIQADGKIVAVGYSDANGGGDDFALVRYTTNGKLDASFGRGGKVVTTLDANGDDLASGVALQSDGKIVVVGSRGAEPFPAAPDHDFALARYTSAGRLDTSFGRGGKVLTDLGRDDGASAVALQSDGKIVAIGYSDTRGSYDFALVRYTSSGRLDAGFGGGGRVLTNLGTKSNDEASAVAIQPGGKIVVAGYSEAKGSNFALARYASGGRLDASFGSGGKVVTDIGLSAGSYDEVSAVAIQPGGKIVVAGYSAAKASNDFALARYTRGGKLDATFGSGGKVVTDLGSKSDDHAHAVAIQSDGRIVTAGYSSTGSIGDFALVRYTK